MHEPLTDCSSSNTHILVHVLQNYWINISLFRITCCLRNHFKLFIWIYLEFAWKYPNCAWNSFGSINDVLRNLLRNIQTLTLCLGIHLDSFRKCNGIYMEIQRLCLGIHLYISRNENVLKNLLGNTSIQTVLDLFRIHIRTQTMKLSQLFEVTAYTTSRTDVVR